jgi:hypothetical protein
MLAPDARVVGRLRERRLLLCAEDRTSLGHVLVRLTRLLKESACLPFSSVSLRLEARLFSSGFSVVIQSLGQSLRISHAREDIKRSLGEVAARARAVLENRG